MMKLPNVETGRAPSSRITTERYINCNMHRFNVNAICRDGACPVSTKLPFFDEFSDKRAKGEGNIAHGVCQSQRAKLFTITSAAWPSP